MNTKVTNNAFINKITKGDCIKLMSKLDDNSIDLVFADPPYYMQLGHGLTRPEGGAVDGVRDEWDSFKSRQHYKDFIISWSKEVSRVLKDEGALWVIGTYHNIYTIGSILQDLDFWILNDVVWHKTNPMPNFRGTRLTNSHEILLWCKKTVNGSAGKYTFNYQAMKAGNEDKQMNADWYLPICSNRERLKDENGKKIHSTQKPESLLHRIILSTTKRGDVILDPFFGTGTTGSVALSLDRKFIGFEANNEYINYSKKRLSKAKPVAKEGKLLDKVLDLTNAPKPQDRIAFGALVELNLIPAGSTLISSCKKYRAIVIADGSLDLISDSSNGAPLRGSIHKLGSIVQGRASCNGWDYWYMAKSNGDIGNSINDIRKETIRKSKQ